MADDSWKHPVWDIMKEFRLMELGVALSNKLDRMKELYITLGDEWILTNESYLDKRERRIRILEQALDYADSTGGYSGIWNPGDRKAAWIENAEWIEARTEEVTP